MSLASRISDLAVAVREKINAMMPRLMPSGGAVGQVITKTGPADYVVGWQDVPAGGGGGSSVSPIISWAI